jgi:cyclic pyranopterin phosphate synthase
MDRKNKGEGDQLGGAQTTDSGSDGLSHLTPDGSAWMVDVGDKPLSARRALASAVVHMRPETAALILSQQVPKGDVLATARLAGIMAAKRTSELIPLCHPIALTRVAVQLDVDAAGRVEIKAAAEARDRTGVEMEAMTAAAVAALTIYDMLKSVDRGMSIAEVVLLEKAGGRSGHYRRQP